MFVLRACLRAGGGGRLLSARAPSKLLAPGPSTHASTTTTHALTAIRPPRALGLPPARPFSSTGGGSGDDDDNKESSDADDAAFLFEDEASLPRPPSYVRDSVTGKWTDEVRDEITPDEAKLLKLTAEERGDALVERVGERWKEAAAEVKAADRDGLGTLNEEHERVARRIQEEQLALGTIGRGPEKAKSEGKEGEFDTEKPLSPREYQALQTYAQKEAGVHPKDFARATKNDPDLIPHNTVASGGEGAADSKDFFDADLDLAYLHPRLNKQAFGADSAAHDDPFADLLPSDLNPARKVNRKHAKPIPRRLMHHNNLSLLRRYCTPGGKVMNRVQSRLGAKDQRKIAKLVKRARHLGLIPHLGQWKYEDHGRLHERGLGDADAAPNGEEAEGKREWEVELEKRGLWPLADDREVATRYYDMEGMMERIAGPRGGKKRAELERLIGGAGALVPGEAEAEGGEGGS
ncbi:hypothetical protein ACHAXT_009131 [Thalassiosira profunda]